MSKSSFTFSLKSLPTSNESKTNVNTERKGSVVDLVFGGLDDDEDGKAPKPSLMHKSLVDKRKVEDLLEEDPNIFKYDEVYEESQSNARPQLEETNKQREGPQVGLVYGGKRTTDAVPDAKYIGNLQRHAQRREIEKEIVEEKMLKKEREKEGDQHKDEEVFVTGGYKKALEKRRKIQEELEKQDAADAANDVTKKADLTDFHRTLLEQREESSRENLTQDGRKTAR